MLKKHVIFAILLTLSSMSPNDKFKPITAFSIIFGSALAVFSLSFLVLKSLEKKKLNLIHSKEYAIESLTQMGPVKEAMKSIYLEELMGLSLDEPLNLYQLDLNETKQKLLDSGVILSAKLKKNFPRNLELDYEVRHPIAYLSDYSNTLVDEKGVIFPLDPYFTPKILPRFYLGITIAPFQYGKVVHEKMQYALDIYDFISKTNLGNGVVIHQVDVSKINLPSLGQREIVLTLYETLANEDFVRYLRLSPTNYKEQLLHFLDLKAMNLPQNLVVDLRMFPNAYLTPLEWRK